MKSEILLYKWPKLRFHVAVAVKLNLISGITTYEYVRAHRLALEPQAQNQLSDPTPEEQNKKDSQYQTTDR